jgi:hypothetical protein
MASKDSSSPQLAYLLLLIEEDRAESAPFPPPAPTATEEASDER